MRPRPIVAITMGDPTGIGPEVIAKALIDPLPADVVVFGDRGAMEASRSFVPNRLEFQTVEAADPVQPGVIGVVPVSELTEEEMRPGRPSPGSDQAQVAAIFAAVEALESGHVDAIATAPISKSALSRTGAHWPGHTEMLAELAGRRRNTSFVPVMMLAGPRIRAITLTTHIPLADVSKALTRPLVRHAIEVAHDELVRSFGLEKPRIAIAGLNPHAGEGGLFGREDLEVLAPEVEAARARNMDVTGPWPADAVFRRCFLGDFDVVISAYHDQALIPVKLVDFDHAVNVTLGLPFVRTSVDHGTAYDLAGKGVASATSMRAAIELACKMALARASSLSVFTRLDAPRRTE